MHSKEKVKNLFSYLLSVKNMDEDVIRNVRQYEKLYWISNLSHIDIKCILIDETKEEWLEIDKNNKQLYDEFFQLYQLIEKNSDSLEIVWSNYILAWNIEGKKIVHPLLTTKMELAFDAEKGKFSLKPYNDKITMEVEMLGGINIQNIQDILKIKEGFDYNQNFNSENKEDTSISITLTNVEQVANLLNKVVHYLSSDINPEGEIQKNLCSISEIKLTKYPVFYNAPVIIVRKSDKRLWHNELNNILKVIDQGYNIPPTIEALINEDNVKLDKEDEQEWKEMGKNLLFPLSANEEQKEVLRKLSQNFGVVVQGPPGTGKSHTIANLVCHLLANGKRVLVTSQTGRALRVLSDKIPEDIRPLCMSILGNDSKSLKELDESVRKITENLSVKPDELTKDIKILKEQLDICKNRQKDLGNKLKEARLIENSKLNYKGNFYRLITAAKWVKENERECSWIEDKISAEVNCPLTDQQFIHLLYLLDKVHKEDIVKLNNINKISKQLPSCNGLCNKVEIFLKLDKNYEKYKRNIKNWSIPYKKDFDYKPLIKLLEQAEKTMEEIENSWLNNVVKGYYSSEIVKPILKNLYMRCSYYIEEIANNQRYLAVHKVELPYEVDIYKLKKDFKYVYDVIKSRGKINKMFGVIHGESQYILRDLMVDGKKINSREQAEIMKIYINQKINESELKKLWNKTVVGYGGEEIENLDVHTVVKLEDNVKKLGTIINWNLVYKSKIITTLGDVAFFNEINWYKKNTYEYLRNGIISIKGIMEYKEANAYIENCRKVLLSVKGIDNLAEAIKEKNLQKIKEAYKDIKGLLDLAPSIQEINIHMNKMEKLVPILTMRLKKEDDRSKYKNFNKAWKWKQLNDILQKAHKIRPEMIEEALEEEKLKEKILIGDIVAKKAWYNQIINTSDLQKRSLYAWAEAVKRIGKGTGKFAVKYRNMAQREMEKCKDSIPVWIMPLNKVIENIKINENLFDVIIFDESSQSDIFALCALFRGKRAVIVGDDKQISPQAVGIDKDTINNLIEKYLKDIPHSEWFDLETSLYNTALRVFPDRLMLKEHFRCTPEIIGFSNSLCYSNEIIPLRHPKIDEILDSPIKTIKVPNGKRDKLRPVNIQEAEALVNEVIKCCNDENYNGMTMGVISLLGEAQAELIENLLIKKLGEREMIKRKIICGDAYSFQGDERDVIFLSMVVADNIRFMPLTKEADVRRFNVAASRARNQMWLFYSIDPEKLNSDCVRAKLLRYCLDPSISRNTSRHEEYIFGSEFQKDVYEVIKAKGYSVKPLVNIGKYKADFIIEGENSRIAVACEGGKWQDDQSLEEEYERQMALERVGWTFCTIRGSEFYRNSESAMQKLWDKLKEMGIEKITA